jgi:hypothetical protein
MIVPSLRESLQQVMEWIDAEEVQIASIQKAHDLLLELVRQPLAQDMSFTERQCTQLLTEPTIFADWLDDQTDLYRCIILSSFLLIQLMERIPEFDLLQDSIERALLVLRVLYNASDDVALSKAILESRYPLLNALFAEPLLPLSKTERRQMWDDTIQPISIQDVDAEHTGIAELILISPKELEREEKQLLDIAGREIPNNQTMAAIPTETFIYEPMFQGKVYYIEGEETIPKKHRLRIYPYGFIAFSVSYSAIPKLYKLETITTITHCVTKDQKMEISLKHPSLSFHVDDAMSGMQWMKAIKEGIAACHVAADLHYELNAFMG